MLETLLESKSKRDRSARGAIVSVMAHTALIATALYATAQARVQPMGSPETVRAVYFPQARNPVSTVRPTTARQRPLANSRSLTFVDPHVDINVSRVDIGDAVSRPGDFSPGPITATESTSGGERGARPADAPFRADQVERQVGLVPGIAAPRYPETLRSLGVEGQVIAEFVVDDEGHAEERSVRFVRSDNQLFEDAV